MAFQILTASDELALRAYSQARDAVRDVMGNGVYPNLVKAIATYDALDAVVAGLAAGDANQQELAAYHGALIAPIAPYVATLRQAAAQIVQTMAAIEAAQPGTFGLPEEPELP